MGSFAVDASVAAVLAAEAAEWPGNTVTSARLSAAGAVAAPAPDAELLEPRTLCQSSGGAAIPQTLPGVSNSTPTWPRSRGDCAESTERTRARTTDAFPPSVPVTCRVTQLSGA